MFNFGGFTDYLHPHRQDTRGMDTIQAAVFFAWWLYFFQKLFEAKGGIRNKNPEIRKTPEKSQACLYQG